MKRIASVVAAALLASCGQESTGSIHAAQVRKALPRAESIQIGAPEATTPSSLAAMAGSRALAVQSAPRTTSPYAAVSYWSAVTFNLGVWATLTTVRVVTLFPPSQCDVDSCTWGPVLGEDGLNTWTLEVTRVGEAYDWTLSAAPVSGGARVTLISGHAVPGADEWHGSGTFTVAFDAAASLDHPAGWVQTDFGTLDVAYDNRASLSIDATFENARSQDPSDPCRMNAAYAFDATQGGGDLQLGVRNLDTTATLRLHTRWIDTGAGRGDAEFVRGSTSVDASQCWDGAPDYLMVFDGTAAEPGSESACAFASPAPPTIAVP